MLVAATPAVVSLGAVAARARADAGLPPHALLLQHQRALVGADAAAGDATDAEGRRLKLRAAFDEACGAVGDDVLSRAMHAGAASAAELWELQRGFTSQLGLHALLCHALGLRATQPTSLLISRDSGGVPLTEFDLPAAAAASAVVPAGGGGGDGPAAPVPFRLSRNLVHFVAPFGVEGAFSASFSAAAECCADEHKCPLELWLDFLAQPEDATAAAGGDGADALGHFPPWSATGAVAAARMRELSPQLIVRAHHPKRHEADVHAKLRALIDQATSVDRLAEMPPAWQPWL